MAVLYGEDKVLRIIPLGGVGEFGRNLTVFEYDDTILCIDAGLMFPSEDMHGIDMVISDVTYLRERAHKVKGFLLTHGHEDHIGALPYILPQINAPIYGAPLTLGLLETKLREHKLLDQADLHRVTSNDRLQIGPFGIEFAHLCHSIPDSLGIALHTPVGIIVHATDFKFDDYPVDGRLTEVDKLRAWGDKGVRVLLADSTNAEVSGFTPSERMLEDTLSEIIGRASGRVIVATFASNVSRVQQVINVAARHGRRVGVTGRSMIQTTRMAQQLGYLHPTEGGEMLRADQMTKLPPERVVIVCTGSQGEPTSALVRMSQNRYPHLSIGRGDTVIVSASPIPGNEKMIHRTLDDLFRLGADVYYDELSEVHVSGHGSREDQKRMIQLTRPQYLIPIHGEYRQLVLHARVARESAIPDANILVIEDGQVIEVGPDWVLPAERVPCGRVFVDGLGVGDIGSIVLRDRQHLARDGFMVVLVGLDENTGDVLVGPEIITRGFIYTAEAENLIEEAKEVVWGVLEAYDGPSTIESHVHDALAHFCYRATHRRPMILPLVVEL